MPLTNGVKRYYALLGNLSSVRNLGGGIFESRINFGAGYRVYFGKDSNDLVILLCGGTKKRQLSQTSRNRFPDRRRQTRQARLRNGQYPGSDTGIGDPLAAARTGS